MNHLRTPLLALLAISTVVLQGQTTTTFEFIDKTRPELEKVQFESTLGEVANSTHFFQLISYTFKKKVTYKMLHAFSRETGKLEHSAKFGEGWPETARFDRMLVLGERLFIIRDDVDTKTGQVDVMAERIDTGTLEASGAPIRIGQMSFDPKTMQIYGGLSSTLIESADGEQVVFYFDRIKSKEDEQLMLVFAMDEDLNAKWQQAYRIPFESDKIFTAGVQVANDGTVYALMRSKFKNRSITNRHINYSYELFGLTEKSMDSQPIALPSGYTALTARLLVHNNAPRVAGFFVEPEQTIQETAGFFVNNLPPGLDAPGQMQARKLAAPLDYQLMANDLLLRPDGGSYLVGGSWEISGAHVHERLLLALSISPDGELEWEVNTPRKLKSNAYEQYGYRALLAGDDLVVLFPDGDENLERYRTGQPPRLESGRKRLLVEARYDRTGKVRYADLFGDGPFSFDISQILPAVNEPGTYPIWIGKRENGKKDYTTGSLYMKLN